MKAFRKDIPFEPVIIELCTQQAVDIFYAIFNFTPITIAFGHAIEDKFDKLRNDLGNYTKDHIPYHDKLCKNLTKR